MARTRQGVRQQVGDHASQEALVALDYEELAGVRVDSSRVVSEYVHSLRDDIRQVGLPVVERKRPPPPIDSLLGAC